MSITTKNEDVVEGLLALNRKIFPLEKIYEVVSDVRNIPVNELKSISYDIFYDVMKGLVAEGYLKKHSKDTNSRGYKSLYKQYKLLNVEVEKNTLSEEDKIFLHSLNRNIDVNIYFKNEDKLEQDREKLIILSDFLDNVCSDTPYISINERSYELFGYEKELTGYKEKDLNGKRKYIGLLSRVKVSLDSLHCFEKSSPLTHSTGSEFHKKKSRKILIIENQDTYDSFVRVLYGTKLCSHLDMVIYGKGNAITGDLKNHTNYTISENDVLYYFGDIDPEGISIYKRLKKIYKNLNFKLEKNLYKLAINIASEKGIRDINNQNQRFPEDDEIDDLLSDLDVDVAKKFKEIIMSGKYVPQEAVNYNILVNLIEKEL